MISFLFEYYPRVQKTTIIILLLMDAFSSFILFGIKQISKYHDAMVLSVNHSPKETISSL